MRRTTIATGLVMAVLLLEGCGAYRAQRRGHAAAREEDWDRAVAHYTIALRKKPENIGYRIALENARTHASRKHQEEARKHVEAELFDKAEEELQIAANYDPSNRGASDELAIVRRRIELREAEKAQRTDYEQMRRKAAANRYPIATLLPRSVHPIAVKLPETSLDKIFRTLGTLSGVNVLFSQDFKATQKATVELAGVTFEQALDQVCKTNKVFYKVLDQNTIIIVPESTANHKAYDELVLRTFYLQHAEATEVQNLVKTAIGTTTKLAASKELRTITVVGTPDRVAIAERVIDSIDKPKGEVLVEVKVLEVDRGKTKDFGLKLSASSGSIAYDPFGNGDTEDADGAATGFTRLRAHLLSSVNLADFVVNVPSTLFASFLQSENNTRILAAPRLRAAEGKATTLQIGEDYPVPVASIQYGTGFSGASTQVQYRPVGVNLKLTPKVSPSGDVELDLEVEFSLVGSLTEVGGQKYPSFLTRKVTGLVRVRDGQTSLIGGLLQSIETKAFSGIFGLQSIPLLNRVFTSTQGERGQKEVLISLTPHIVRGPRLGPDDLAGLAIGTEDSPRVRGARQPLFGPPEEDQAAEGSSSDPGSTPPAGTSTPSARPSPVSPRLAPQSPANPRSMPNERDRGSGVMSVPPKLPPDDQGRSPQPMMAPSAPSAEVPVPPAPNDSGAPDLRAPEPPSVPVGMSLPGPTAIASPTNEPQIAASQTPAAATGPSVSRPATSSPAAPAAAAPQLAASSLSGKPATSSPAPPPLRAMLSPREVRVKAGEAALVGIVLTGARDLKAAELVLAWGSGVVEVADVTTGPLLTLDSSPVGKETVAEPNRLTIRFNRPTGTSGSGVLANVALRGTRPGSSELSVVSLVIKGAAGETSAMLPEAVRVEVLP